MIFLGRYYHALEQKGRLSIPAAFRSKLGEHAILTAGLDGCLFLLDESQWQSLVSDVESSPVTKRNARDWARYLANNASEVEFDRLGRILIPEYLREQVNLAKDVVIVGSVNRVEIWDREIYHTYLKQVESNVESIAESLEPTSHV